MYFSAIGPFTGHGSYCPTIYFVFGDCRSVPRGTGLPRLLYGITGQPLKDEAVKFATEVDEQTKTAGVAIAAVLDAGSAAKLVVLAGLTDVHWISSPMPG